MRKKTLKTWAKTLKKGVRTLLIGVHDCVFLSGCVESGINSADAILTLKKNETLSSLEKLTNELDCKISLF